MRTTFLGSQFKYLCQSFPQRKKLWHRLYFFYETGQILGKYASLQQALQKPAPPLSTGGRTCTVILLSHNRPQNLQMLVRGALQNDFVRKVIVSNSNPKFRIAEWVTSQDQRLQLIDETKKTLPGHRFVIAADEPGDYFLSVDDDIFFEPRQWARFFECLLQDESVPHGISGQVYRPEVLFSNGTPFHHLENTEADADVLIGAYAFTRKHLDLVFELAEELKLGSLTNVGNGEDILLSFAGNRAARIHDLDRPWLCASTSLKGVALWKTRDDFWDERVKLFEQVRSARTSLGKEWKPSVAPA